LWALVAPASCPLLTGTRATSSLPASSNLHCSHQYSHRLLFLPLKSDCLFNWKKLNTKLVYVCVCLFEYMCTCVCMSVCVHVFCFVGVWDRLYVAESGHGPPASTSPSAGIVGVRNHARCQRDY
jgi:hypothetical protein